MDLDKTIILIGSILLGIGLLMSIAAKYNLPLGKLPGDIKIEKKNMQIYIPLTTSILLSLFITVILWLIRTLRS